MSKLTENTALNSSFSLTFLPIFPVSKLEGTYREKAVTFFKKEICIFRILPFKKTRKPKNLRDFSFSSYNCDFLLKNREKKFFHFFSKFLLLEKKQKNLAMKRKTLQNKKKENNLNSKQFLLKIIV